MRKHFFCVMGVLLVLTFLGCPADSEDKDTPTGPAADPVLPAAGTTFFYGEDIPIKAEAGASIYYTLDGTEPKIGGSLYDKNKPPKANFDLTDTITVKALATWGTSEEFSSQVVSGTYGESIPKQGTLRALAKEIANDSRGDTVDNPVPVKVGPEISLDDIGLSYLEGTEDEVYDDIGGLYKAFGSKYVTLDLSDVNWKVLGDDGEYRTIIPGMIAPTSTANWLRPNRDRLVSVKFPKDTVSIGSKAFRQCFNLREVDFDGLSKLRVIEDQAFYNCTSLKEVVFKGCAALEFVYSDSFRYCDALEMVDMADCAKLMVIGDRAFRQNKNLMYVEFPPSPFFSFGDYVMDYTYSLKYVRFRTTTPTGLLGWSLWWYSNHRDATRAGNHNLPLSHYTIGFADLTPAHMNVYRVFHPNTVAWISLTGGFWTENSERDNYQSRHIPLPYTGDEKNVYPANIDKLRGEDLLNYDDGIHGQNTVTVNATGLDAKYNGKIVKSSIGNVQATIANGAVNLTIPVPTAAELKQLDDTTGQIFTGLYDDTMYYNRPSDRFTENAANGEWTSSEGGYKSAYGKPWVWPTWQQGGTGVNFALLVLTVHDTADGPVIGYLQRSGRSAYDTAWGNRTQMDRWSMKTAQTMAYVYVDKNTAIYRHHRVNLPGMEYTSAQMWPIWMNLKPGWSPIEALEELGDRLKIWSSGGVMVDNKDGIPDLKYPDVGRVDVATSINIPFKPIPWKISEVDLYQAMVSPKEKPTEDSPQWK